MVTVTSRRVALSLSLLLLGSGLGSGGVVEAGDLEAGLQEARGRLVEDLLELAGWARGQRLYGRRDATYEVVLRFDPDEPEARRWLKYRRAEDGTWVQDPRYRAPPDRVPSLRPRYEERLRAVFEAYRDAVLATCRAAREPEGWERAVEVEEALLELLPEDPRVREALRDTLLARRTWEREHGRAAVAWEVEEQIRRRFPLDPAAREPLGDVAFQERWVLPETRRALERRALLERRMEEVRTHPEEPAEGSLADVEMEARLLWWGPFEAGRVRVAGTLPEETVLDMARTCGAAGSVFEAVLGQAPSGEDALTLYLFRTKEDWQQFLDESTLFDADWRERMREPPLRGFAIGGSRYAIWGMAELVVLREMAVLAVFDTFLVRAFATAECGQMRGWMYEGLSRYLTWRLTETRLCATVDGRYAPSGPGVAARMPTGTDWLAEAARAVAAGATPDLGLLLSKDAAAFTRQDALLAHAFAVYLVEGDVERAGAFLRRGGACGDAAAAAEEVLGLDLESVARRLRRWLEEMVAPP